MWSVWTLEPSQSPPYYMMARSWRERVRQRRKHGPAAAKLRGSAKTRGMARRRGATATERKKKKMA